MDAILLETKEILDEGYFTELEEEHFHGRVDAIEKRNTVLGENAAKKQKRSDFCYHYFLECF